MPNEQQDEKVREFVAALPHLVVPMQEALLGAVHAGKFDDEANKQLQAARDLRAKLVALQGKELPQTVRYPLALYIKELEGAIKLAEKVPAKAAAAQPDPALDALLADLPAAPAPPAAVAGKPGSIKP